MKNIKLKNETYDLLKYIVVIVLPAFVSFYVTIANIWNLPLALEVWMTIEAIANLLRTLFMKSKEKE